MPDVFVGRQPIYDQRLEVYAYELLYRSDPGETARFADGDQATSEILVNTFLEIGLDTLVGARPVFINLTRGFVTGELPLPFDKDRLVLEVLENIPVDRELIDAVRELASQGYAIALDDFVYRHELEPLVQLATIVKVDLLQVDRAALAEHVRKLRRPKLKLLAEKVETPEDFDYCKQLGFDLFQGYFFCRPRVVTGRRLPGNRLAVMQLLARLQDPAIGFDELEKLIARDVSLCHKLLRYINSAHMALPRKIDSIRQALVLLGLKRIRNLVTLITLAGIQDKPSELLTTAMIRARMCECLGTRLAEDGQPYFTVGLFSVLDAMMDAPMETVLNELPLADEVNAALLRGEGLLGAALQCAVHYERARWDEVRLDDVALGEIKDAYLESVAWSIDASNELH